MVTTHLGYLPGIPPSRLIAAAQSREVCPGWVERTGSSGRGRRDGEREGSGDGRVGTIGHQPGRTTVAVFAAQKVGS